MTVLLQTIHGSHLYGLNHKDSDVDTFTVIADNPTIKGTYARQSIRQDGTGHTSDDLITDLSTFVLYASKGVPQYLEAMWSTKAHVDGINDFRFSFWPDYYSMQAVYQRTIRNFYDSKELKKKRHAYRLVLNLQEFRENGIFNPTLNEEGLEAVEYMLRHDQGPDVYLGEQF